MQVLKKLTVCYSKLFLFDVRQQQTNLASGNPLNWAVGNKVISINLNVKFIFPLGEMTTLLKIARVGDNHTFEFLTQPSSFHPSLPPV